MADTKHDNAEASELGSGEPSVTSDMKVLCEDGPLVALSDADISLTRLTMEGR